MESSQLSYSDLFIHCDGDYNHILFWAFMYLSFVVLTQLIVLKILPLKILSRTNLIHLRLYIVDNLTKRVLRPNGNQTIASFIKNFPKLKLNLISNRLPAFLYKLYKKLWR